MEWLIIIVSIVFVACAIGIRIYANRPNAYKYFGKRYADNGKSYEVVGIMEGPVVLFRELGTSNIVPRQYGSPVIERMTEIQ